MDEKEIALELTKVAIQSGLLNLPNEVISSNEQFIRDRAAYVAEAYTTIYKSISAETSIHK